MQGLHLHSLNYKLLYQPLHHKKPPAEMPFPTFPPAVFIILIQIKLSTSNIKAPKQSCPTCPAQNLLIHPASTKELPDYPAINSAYE